jgi:hypothetical protein
MPLIAASNNLPAPRCGLVRCVDRAPLCSIACVSLEWPWPSVFTIFSERVEIALGSSTIHAFAAGKSDRNRLWYSSNATHTRQ